MAHTLQNDSWSDKVIHTLLAQRCFECETSQQGLAKVMCKKINFEKNAEILQLNFPTNKIGSHLIRNLYMFSVVYMLTVWWNNMLGSQGLYVSLSLQTRT